MCKTPLNVRVERSDGYRTIPVPCGKCNDCIYSRIVSWQFRLECEYLHSEFRPLFVTFTYDKHHVKRGLEYDKPNGRAYVRHILESRDMTLYWKRLRFARFNKFKNRWASFGYCPLSEKPSSIKYWYVGEYGTKRKRPHYHAILFGIDDLRLIQDTWEHGHVDIRFMDSPSTSVGYCLKYLFKKNSYSPCGFKPFMRASKGIGSCYINRETVRYHNSDFENCFVSTLGDVKLTLPKYLKDRIYDEPTRFLVTYHLQNRIDKMQSDRVKLLMNNSGRSEEEILYDLFVEPQKSLPSFHNQVF